MENGLHSTDATGGTDNLHLEVADIFPDSLTWLNLYWGIRKKYGAGGLGLRSRLSFLCEHRRVADDARQSQIVGSRSQIMEAEDAIRTNPPRSLGRSVEFEFEPSEKGSLINWRIETQGLGRYLIVIVWILTSS